MHDHFSHAKKMVVTPFDLLLRKLHARCKPHGSMSYRTRVMANQSL